MKHGKKILASVMLASLVGTTSLQAGKGLVDFVLECYIIDKILGLITSGVAYISDKYEAQFGKEALRFAERPRPAQYRKIKIPELKRHVNFIVIKNMSKGAWTFQVASLSRDEIAAKDEKNLPESGTVTVFKTHPDSQEYPLEQVAVCKAGGAKVALEPGIDYFFYPNLEGKVGSLKAFADDFQRTIYLEDARGGKYACNLARGKESKARVTFGVTRNSWPAVQKNMGLEMDLGNPTYDDMFFITKDVIESRPQKAN